MASRMTRTHAARDRKIALAIVVIAILYSVIAAMAAEPIRIGRWRSLPRPGPDAEKVGYAPPRYGHGVWIQR
jgi:hypothetical protein